MSRINSHSIIKHGKSSFFSKRLYHECIEQKHSNVRNMAKDVEILSGKSTAQSGLCWIYLLGTFHRSEESRSEARSLVKYLKPDIFGTLPPTRKKYAKNAYMEAQKYNIKVIFGDMDYERFRKVRDERIADWIISRPHKMLDEIFEEARQMTIMDDRDKYMIDGIIEISKHSSSILAIVGKDHLPGMKKLWDERHLEDNITFEGEGKGES